MAGRYASNTESYAGSKIFHEIWRKSEILSKEVFRCKAASVSPISGHLPSMMSIHRICKRGDKIAVLSVEDGGYRGYTKGHIPSLFGLEVIHLPFEKESHNINLEKTVSLLASKRPKLVVLGATVFLFPHPAKEIAETAHSYGARVLYDGSHVLGLIAGEKFQDPLKEGVDLLIGSTHKTFFGPQGGLILSNDTELLRTIEEGFRYTLMDNFHLNRVAALAVALEEMKLHRLAYAGKIVENSNKLATSLDNFGIPVAAKSNGFTESHQVLLNYGTDGMRVRDQLESNGIIVDSRVRLGTNEVTRRSMNTKHMENIADLICESLRNPNDVKIRGKVLSLVSRFKKIRFTLKERFSTKSRS